VHGFGFSFALRETLQFAGDYLLTALFGFNLGVEIGQLRCCSRWCRRSACCSLRRARAARHHHPVGAGRAHGLALDAGARRMLARFPLPTLVPRFSRAPCAA